MRHHASHTFVIDFHSRRKFYRFEHALKVNYAQIRCGSKSLVGPGIAVAVCQPSDVAPERSTVPGTKPHASFSSHITFNYPMPRETRLLRFKCFSAVSVPLLLLALLAPGADGHAVPFDDAVHSADANPAAHDLARRQVSPSCKMPVSGRQICGPMCGSCPENHCCRGSDMT